jgi:translation initiation factor IF-1
MVKNTAGGCNGKKVARKHTTKSKNELRLSKSSDEKYAIVKKLLGNTCDVICDDGVNRRCIIRGKFTGRNKRDNMIDSGIYVLIGLREWVDEGVRSRQSDENVKYCDLLEVYNSMERDILRRTHNVFSTLKDESGNKYDNGDTSVMFVDENTLKYQNVIKNMDKGKKDGNSGEDDEGGEDDEDIKYQTTVITTKVKHVGKGVIVQAYDISDDSDDNESDSDNNDYDNKKNKDDNMVMKTSQSTSQVYNISKKIAYTADKNIDVDDI